MEKQTEYIKTLNDVEKIYEQNKNMKSEIQSLKTILDSSVKEKEKLISTCNAKVKEITEVYEADNESAKKNKRKYEALLSQEEELIQSTINEKTEEIKRQLEEQSQLEIKNKKNLMDKKYKSIENLNEWVLLFCLIWSGVQAIVNK